MAGRRRNPYLKTLQRSTQMTDIMQELSRILEERQGADPASSYVAQLHSAGLNKILEKVGEEATETIIAAKDASGSSDNTPIVFSSSVAETAGRSFAPAFLAISGRPEQ